MNDFHTTECCAEHGCPKPCNFCKYPLKDAIKAKRKEIEAASPTLASNWGMRDSADSIDSATLEKLRLQDEADSLRAQLATATERATKAEAGLSLAVRALKELKAEYDEQQNRDPFRRVAYKWSLTRINYTLSVPAILAEAERLKALEKDRERMEAAEQQLPAGFEWHAQRLDSGGWQIGVLRRGYSDAITYPTYRQAIDAAIAQSGTEVKL